MKVKYPQYYKTKSQQDYFIHFIREIEKYPEVEVVGERDYADLSINNNSNAGIKVMLDRSDPHGNLPDFDVDSLLDPELTKITIEYYKVPLTTITPSIAWAKRMINPPIIDAVEKFDLYSPPFVTNAHKKFAEKFKHAKLFPIPISLPEEIFYKSDEKNLDLYFTGSVCFWYPYRKMFLDTAENLNLNSLILRNQTGSVMTHKYVTVEEYDNQLIDYANNLRKSKVTMIDGGIFNYPVKKYIEAMACGCLVLGPVPIYAAELGFINEETMVEVNKDDYKDKLLYYLNHDNERKRITDNAYELFRERHTCKKSVQRLMEKINELK